KIAYEKVKTGKSIEALLAEKQIVNETDLTKAKAEFYKVPFIDLEEVGVSPEAITQLPEGVARRYFMLPFALNKQDNSLSVAMADPLDLSAIDFAEQKTGYRILPHYAAPSQLERKVAERYAQNLGSEVKAALKETDQGDTAETKLADLAALSKGVVR